MQANAKSKKKEERTFMEVLMDIKKAFESPGTNGLVLPSPPERRIGTLHQICDAQRCRSPAVPKNT